MMTRRLLPAMMVALLLSGLFTVWLSRKFSRPTVQAAVATKPVVTVVKNMAAGEPLLADSLKIVERPASDVPRGSFAKPEEVVGKTLLIPITAGDPVLDHALTAGVSNGLTAKIPQGMRAISLRSDEVAGVSGFLLPGSLADVLVTYAPSAGAPMITTTVLQNARILAEGQKIEAEGDGKASQSDVVTLLVTPDDAQRLTLASTMGKIQFVLRNGGDRQETAGLAPQTSLPGQGVAHSPTVAPVHGVAKVVKAAPSSYAVETVAGGKQAITTFEERAR